MLFPSTVPSRLVLSILVAPILLRLLVTAIPISITITITIYVVSTCMRSMFTNPPLLPPAHLMCIPVIVTSCSSVEGRGITTLFGWAHLEYKADGAQELTRIHHSREGANAQESTLIVLGITMLRGVTTLGMMVTALDHVWADVVGVVEEDGEGDHDEAVYNGWDTDCHIGLTHRVAWCQGRGVEAVEDPKYDLGDAIVSMAGCDYA